MKSIMGAVKPYAVIERFADLDLMGCRLCNRACQLSFVTRLFALISRMGDGIFWYCLMLVIPLIHGAAAVETSVRMAVTGVFGLTIYKLIKSSTGRLRPYMVDAGVRPGTPPLDLYSFPSGHTLHATSFAIIAAESVPGLFWLVVPFAVLVALSRVVLGLHYPTDVLAGAGIGALLAVLVLSI
jgi:undecaprenyl-diphosphatase